MDGRREGDSWEGGSLMGRWELMGGREDYGGEGGREGGSEGGREG